MHRPNRPARIRSRGLELWNFRNFHSLRFALQTIECIGQISGAWCSSMRSIFKILFDFSLSENSYPHFKLHLNYSNARTSCFMYLNAPRYN